MTVAANEKNNILVISASSRPAGHTNWLMERISQEMGGEFVDITSLNISYYNYDHTNQNDDFIPLAEKMTQATHIILGSPVYWYSVSAQMKTFMDRWSDLLTIRKDLGRALKGKKLMLVSMGSWEESGEGFELPFKQTAEYMDMSFAGYFHTWIADNEDFSADSVQKRLNLLLENIQSKID